MKMRVVLVLVAGATLLATGSGSARTWHIFPSGTGDAPTIQAGIDSASAGDTVLVGCGTYHEFNVRMKGGICLRGESADSACAVIDAEDDGRVLICDSLTGTTRIEGLRLIRGVNPTSGADRDGAGLYCRYSSPLISDCVFDDNYCSWVNGGGMVATGGSAPVLTRCVFSNNTAGNYGGGLYCVDSSAAVVQDCEFVGNFASWWGGGFACGRFSDATAANCVFRENRTNHQGGGFAAISKSMPIVSHSLFLENWAGGYGGAVAGYKSALATIASCTFFGNEADDGSLVLARDTAQVYFERCIVTRGNCKPARLWNVGAYVSFSCSDVWGNTGGDWVGVIAGQDTINGNLSVDPEFCGAGNGDLSLAATSPCLTAACGAMGAFGEGCGIPPRSLWYVRPDGSGDLPTIQAALDTADHGDTLVLGDGTFSGPGNRDLDARDKDLTIYSESRDPALCAIDCGGSQAEPHAGFRFDASHPRTGSLAGVTIRNAYTAASGGAVYLKNYTFALDDCVLEDNRAAVGGGLWARGGSLAVTGTRFQRNDASNFGPALSSGTVTTEVSECSFIENGSPTSEPAIDVSGWNFHFSRCSVERNQGGGFSITAPNRMLVEECSIVDNHGVWLGGGARVFYEVMFGQEPCTFRNCLFAGNSAVEGGAVGAYLLFYDDIPGYLCAVLDSCTIVGNSAPTGSALRYWAEYAWMEIRNSIFAFNDSGSAVESWATDPDCPVVSCTDIYGNKGGDWTGCLAGLLGVNGNISLDPLFCDTAGGDFTLDETSPCLDAPGCGRIGAYGLGCGVVTDVAGGDPSIPERAFLAANRPNPFNPTTTLRFGIPKPAIVELSVLDVTGRRVAVLESGPRRAGEFARSWDGTDDAGRPVGSGIYFFRLEAGDFEEVRKGILIR